MDIGELSVRDLAAGAPHTPLLADDAMVEFPLLFVDLDEDQKLAEAELQRAIDRARDCDRILIGVTRNGVSEALMPLVEALDLTLVQDTHDVPRCCMAVSDLARTAATLQRHAEAAPQSSLLLARLLRIGESLSVSQALELESLTYSTLLAEPGFAEWLARRDERYRVPLLPASDSVIYRRDGGALRLTLNRPERRNAFSRDVRDALVAGLRIAQLDETITEVFLDGRGPSFCSGGDLAEFGTARVPSTAHLVRMLAGAARPLHELSARVTALLHGHCVGAGIELAAFAGTVIADPETRFRLPELEMGLIPGAGGTVSIPRRIGRWRTLYMVIMGTPIPADLALRWGLIDRIEPVGPAT